MTRSTWRWRRDGRIRNRENVSSAYCDVAPGPRSSSTDTRVGTIGQRGNLARVSDIPTLYTPRLTLRAWREKDRAPFAALNADPQVMAHFPATLSRVASDEFIIRAQDTWRLGYGLWAVEGRATGEFEGYIGFSRPAWCAPFTPCIEIGWRLARSSWGRGLATEGATAALSWAKSNVAFPRGEVVSFTTESNERSRRVMEKLDFTHDAGDDFDHPLVPEGPHRRHVLYRRLV